MALNMNYNPIWFLTRVDVIQKGVAVNESCWFFFKLYLHEEIDFVEDWFHVIAQVVASGLYDAFWHISESSVICFLPKRLVFFCMSCFKKLHPVFHMPKIQTKLF
jgi:hypothetical protein